MLFELKVCLQNFLQDEVAKHCIQVRSITRLFTQGKKADYHIAMQILNCESAFRIQIYLYPHFLKTFRVYCCNLCPSVRLKNYLKPLSLSCNYNILIYCLNSPRDLSLEEYTGESVIRTQWHKVHVYPLECMYIKSMYIKNVLSHRKKQSWFSLYNLKQLDIMHRKILTLLLDVIILTAI